MTGFDFSDPRAPDILLHAYCSEDDAPWKVVMKYDCEKFTLSLYINDMAFTDLPVQTELFLPNDAHQLITRGEIKLNGMTIHKGSK